TAHPVPEGLRLVGRILAGGGRAIGTVHGVGAADAAGGRARCEAPPGRWQATGSDVPSGGAGGCGGSIVADCLGAIIAPGLRPRYAPRPDGKVYRCSTESHPHRRNGAYMLSTSGDFGWYQDWSKDSEAVIWTKSGGSSDPAP